MGQPAARIGDMHTCPMVTPGTPPVPHVGGPILPPGTPTVLIGGMPAAALGNMCTCVGPPDSIAKGSIGVLVGGKPLSRLLDTTAHGGVIAAGCPTVLVGDLSPVQVVVALNIILNLINANGGTINCGQIIDSVAALMRGEGINLAPIERDGSWEEIDTRMGTKLDWSNPTNFASIYADLESRGHGSMTLIGIDYGNGVSHVVIAANVDGNVGIMEGQGNIGFITDPNVANNQYGNGGASTVVADAIP